MELKVFGNCNINTIPFSTEKSWLLKQKGAKSFHNIYIHQIIMLNTYNEYNVICQLSLNLKIKKNNFKVELKKGAKYLSNTENK